MAEDWEEFGLKGFSIRFTALPIKVDKVSLYAAIIPLSKEKLEEKLAATLPPPSSPLCL